MTTIDEYVHAVIEDFVTIDREDDTWDEEPTLALLLSPDDVDPDKVRVAILNTDLWARAETVRVIQTMAIAIATPDRPPPPFPLQDGDQTWAVILCTEGWALAGARPPAELEGEAARKAWNAEESERIEEWSRQGKAIVDHPRAVEVKVYSAVTREGTRHSYTMWRRPAHPLPDQYIPEDGWADGEKDGRIFDALEAFGGAMRFRYEEHFGIA